MSQRRRRHVPRHELLARLHRGLRPKLAADQLRDLGLCHHENLDAIVRGTPDPDILWDYAGSVFTWWKAATLLGVGEPEMAVQLEVAARLCERWQRTGAVRFDGPDLELARQGVQVMDELARIVDRPTAIQAAEWSEREIERMARAARGRA